MLRLVANLLMVLTIGNCSQFFYLLSVSICGQSLFHGLYWYLIWSRLTCMYSNTYCNIHQHEFCKHIFLLIVWVQIILRCGYGFSGSTGFPSTFCWVLVNSLGQPHFFISRELFPSRQRISHPPLGYILNTFHYIVIIVYLFCHEIF